MGKLVDAPASGAGDRKVVEGRRVPAWAPNTLQSLIWGQKLFFQWQTVNFSKKNRPWAVLSLNL